jgi:hypothetical protein
MTVAAASWRAPLVACQCAASAGALAALCMARRRLPTRAALRRCRGTNIYMLVRRQFIADVATWEASLGRKIFNLKYSCFCYFENSNYKTLDFWKMGHASVLGVLLVSLIFSVASVNSTECSCDCPLGCKIFTNSFGVFSDGSGSSCIKDGFGVTGQYGYDRPILFDRFICLAIFFTHIWLSW